MPSEGPCRVCSPLPCRLCVDHRRERKTGPCFALVVLRCRVHRRGFTLYPPGHVPYGRVAMAPVAPDGEWMGSDAPNGSGRSEGFEGAFFQAALDAAQGRAWPRECPGGSLHWWSTQGRRLQEAVLWLGVAPDLDPAHRLRQAEALEVDAMALREAGGWIGEGSGYRSRGRAVQSILGRLSRGGARLERLLLAGHQAGLWGPPLFWDEAVAQLRSRGRERQLAKRLSGNRIRPRKGDLPRWGDEPYLATGSPRSPP